MTLDPLYSVEREFAHPIEGMWHAWTDAASLEEWYRPLDLSVVPGSVTSEVEVGGWWTVAVDVPDEGFVAYFFGRYTRLEPMTAIEHTMHFTLSADEFEARDESGPSHRIVIDLEDRGAATWVRFAQFGELPEGEPDRARAGMESYFDSLGRFLDD